MSKLSSLAKFLEVEKKEIKQGYNENVFEYGDKEYLILTDSEANKAAKEYILESVWAFKTWFILDNLNAKFNKSNRDILEKMIETAKEKCEDGNDIILEMIRKIDFVNNAISADGRGHFLSSYDGDENEKDSYYIYRTN